ncbi:MAG: GNAT family N-acetyltransferase [Bacteroidota bacterium]
MNSELPYLIKRFQPDHINDMADLYHAVYRRRIPPGFFTNKYNTAHTGIKHIGFLAYNEAGNPIAFYGVIPCFLQMGAKAVLAAQSADTMTHPKYQGKGLFTKLANLTFNLCKENGIRVIFGFPNQNSLPGFINKLGWQVTDTMDCFVIPVNRFDWEKLIKRLPVLNRLYAAYISHILKKHIIAQPGLNNSALREGYDGVYRTDDYLKYKTYNNTKVIKANRALVWLKVSNGLIIGDISLATDNFNSVMRTVTRLARKIGVKQVLFHACPGTRMHQLFNERYWSVKSFPVIFKDLGSRLPINRIKFTSADIDTF